MLQDGLIQYDSLVLEGPPSDTILEVANNKQVDFIVMGTKGTGRYEGGPLGRATTRVMQKAKCPVLTVPESSLFGKQIKNITFATDYHMSDVKAVEEAVRIASLMGARINIVHVSDDRSFSAEDESEFLRRFMKQVRARVDYDQLSFQILHGKDTEEKLERYVTDQNTDLLVMSTHNRSFLERILGRGLARNIVRHSTIPVLAFHYQPESEVRLY
jgi:nucleotide-binding universal stress UspA family protein